MRGETSLDKFLNWLFVDRIPVTKLLIISSGLTFFMVALFRLGVIVDLLAFASTLPAVMSKPWTAFTYPLVWPTRDPISLLFAGYWMWVAGGSLERAWGTRTFAVYFFGMSAVTALGIFIGSYFGGPTVLAGLWLPLAGVTVAFAMMNPEQQILFFFIIPLKLKYLALLDVILVLLAYSRGSIILGIFALSGCALSYWYVRRGRSLSTPSPRVQPRRNNVVRLYRKPSLLSKLSPFRWLREYRERKRLKKLLGR